MLDGLVDLGDRTRYPILKDALQDPDLEISDAAARTLWRIGAPAVGGKSDVDGWEFLGSREIIDSAV